MLSVDITYVSPCLHVRVRCGGHRGEGGGGGDSRGGGHAVHVNLHQPALARCRAVSVSVSNNRF